MSFYSTENLVFPSATDGAAFTTRRFGDQVGSAVVTGDFNGDGFGDLAIGA